MNTILSNTADKYLVKLVQKPGSTLSKLHTRLRIPNSVSPKVLSSSFQRVPSHRNFYHVHNQPPRPTAPNRALQFETINSPRRRYPATTNTPTLLRKSSPFSTTAKLTMASDEDYMSFLDKANKDPSEGYVKQTVQDEEGGFRATEEGVEIPRAIGEVIAKDAFYVSDADEPFEGVALRLEGGLPDEEEFARLIKHPMPKEASVEIMDPIDWDRAGQYGEIIDAVREAGEGNDVRVYRVARGGVKAEYWVVAATTDGRLVGVRALAVES